MSRKIHYEAKPTAHQLQVLAGTLLGDSSISSSKGSRNCYLSCYHCEDQLEYLHYKNKLLSPMSRPVFLCAYTDKRNGKTYRGGRFHTVSAPIFTGLRRRFYPNGKKRITPRILRFFTEPIALALLIGDDGSWDKAGIQIATKQFPKEDNELLVEHIRRYFGLNPYVMPTGRYWAVRFGAKDVAALRNICMPFLPESMHYKFGPPNYETTLTGKDWLVCPVCGADFEAYPSDHREFCSVPCSLSGKRTGWDAPNRPVIFHVCPICGDTFQAYRSNHIYCSNKRCSRQAASHRPANSPASISPPHLQRTSSFT